MGSIDWMPIGDLPGPLNSAKAYLLWMPDGVELGFYQDSGPDAGEWMTNDEEVVFPTHVAEITSPAGA